MTVTEIITKFNIDVANYNYELALKWLQRWEREALMSNDKSQAVLCEALWLIYSAQG